SGAADGDGPDHRPAEVEEQEARVGHEEGAGERSGEHAQAGDKAGDKHRPVAGFQNERLSAVVVTGRHKEPAAQPPDQRRPAEMSYGVAQAVADRRACNGSQNGAIKAELSVEGQETRKEQDGLAGHGYTGVLQHHTEENHPVTVALKEMRERL